MNFFQKQILGGLSFMIGMITAIVGIFTHPAVMWVGVALTISGLVFAGYTMYRMFSMDGMTEAAGNAASMIKELEEQMDENAEFPRVVKRTKSIGVKHGANRRSGLFIAIDDDDKD